MYSEKNKDFRKKKYTITPLTIENNKSKQMFRMLYNETDDPITRLVFSSRFTSDFEDGD